MIWNLHLLFLYLYICLFECGIKINNLVYWLLVLRQAGMVINRGRTHGKMEYWVPTALSLQTLTTLTSFKLRIRLGRSHISHQLYCTKPLEGLEDLMCMRDLRFQSLFQILMEISLCLLVIGIKSTTRSAGYNFFFPLFILTIFHWSLLSCIGMEFFMCICLRDDYLSSMF